jgi:hypothetical protein
MPLRWFFTATDGTRYGPFSPHVLQQMAAADGLRASAPGRQGAPRTYRRIDGRFTAPPRPRGDQNR